MQSVGANNVWRPSLTPHWAHDSSLESSSSLVLIWLMKQVIWILHVWENEIFPRLLKKWSNSLVANVFLTFLQNHDTYVKIRCALRNWCYAFGQEKILSPLTTQITSKASKLLLRVLQIYLKIYEVSGLSLMKNILQQRRQEALGSKRN